MRISNQEFDIFTAGYSPTTAAGTTYETTAPVNMGLYSSMLGVVTFGKNFTAAANNLFVLQASSAGYLGEAMAAYTYRYCTTGGISTGSYDSFTAYATGAATALATTTGSGACYIISVKADDLSASCSHVRISMSTNAAERVVTITYFCKPRYLQNTMIAASTGTTS